MIASCIDFQFQLNGQRYELLSWRQTPIQDGFELLRLPPDQCRQVLASLAEDPVSRASFRAQAAELVSQATRLATPVSEVDAVVTEVERGRLVLWRRIEARDYAQILDVEPETVELADLGDEPAAEEEEEEEPLHVMVRIHYDPDRPEAWDDKLRLFTTSDEGGTYDQEVDLSSDAQTEREERHLLVLFKDVVPDQEYSCFLDLGQTEGGYLVFHRHRLSKWHRVEGLPKDVG